jgi:hypothetical protein
MVNKRIVTALIADLDRISVELGKAMDRLNSEDSGVLVPLRRALWEVVMTLEAQKKLCLSVSAGEDTVRCDALRQLSQCAGKEVLPLLHGIMADPHTPRQVVDVARDASQRIDLRTSRNLLDEFDRRMSERLENLLRRPELHNYDGFVCARFLSGQQKPLRVCEGSFQTSAGQSGVLQVWLQPEPPAGVTAEPVTIRDGRDAPEVPFEIILDSETVLFEPHRQGLKVHPAKVSQRLEFPFGAPVPAGKHFVWVQVFQINRLIQCAQLVLEAKSKGSST